MQVKIKVAENKYIDTKTKINLLIFLIESFSNQIKEV